MVIDTSALVAIFLREPERQAFKDAIQNVPVRLLSAASLVETGIVLESRKGDVIGRELDFFLHELEIEIVAVDSRQAQMARQAFRKFGKGRHAAGLNYGDCFAYALSAVSGEPLLAKGQDFRLTDITLVEPQ